MRRSKAKGIARSVCDEALHADIPGSDVAGAETDSGFLNMGDDMLRRTFSVDGLRSGDVADRGKSNRSVKIEYGIDGSKAAPRRLFC
jgi:hypothetical protein